MRLGLCLSLLAHAAAAGAAWALLGSGGGATAAGPSLLVVRQRAIADAEPPPPPVPPPLRPADPSEPIEPSRGAEALDEIEPPPLPETVKRVWTIPDRRWVSHPTTLRSRRPPVAAKATRAPATATISTRERRRPRLQSRTAASPLVLAAPLPGQAPAAHYPARARRLGLEGTVVVSAHVGTDGKVARAEVKRSSGHASLDKAALTTVRLWKFSPATRGGKPVARWVSIPFRFELKTRR